MDEDDQQREEEEDGGACDGIILIRPRRRGEAIGVRPLIEIFRDGCKHKPCRGVGGRRTNKYKGFGMKTKIIIMRFVRCPSSVVQ